MFAPQYYRDKDSTNVKKNDQHGAHRVIFSFFVRFIFSFGDKKTQGYKNKMN